MVGQILGNRYELLEKIGGGGMALVYKARCRLLNRYVAVKILRPEFTNDEEFVKRFRVEAQAAASLSHPNIVPIFDVGQEEGVHYLVMELIDGVTLKQYIMDHGQLNWKEAVNIAIQICSAIEHAHRNHIVHRDIKPHNILLTRDGIAKVTDFGIARAVSSSTITMVGSTIGSVHYFSPEQARGGFSDEKSDLYSLGICLYEMVTGRLPFDGETPVAVALKHIQIEPKQPVEINPDIPAGVNGVIVKAMKKEQAKRYQSASEMLKDLYHVLREPSGSFLAREEEEYPTKRMEAINGGSVIKGGSVGEEDDGMEEEGETVVAKKKKGDRLTVILAVITSVIIMSIGVYIGFNYVVPSLNIEPSKKDFVVGNYVGEDITAVREELEKAGITPNVVTRFDDKREKGTVISQIPEEGKTLKVGGISSVDLVVSDGPELVTLEDLAKIDYKIAETKLRNKGLVPKVVPEYSEGVGIGLVTRTEPEAQKTVESGSVVTIYRSEGPELKQTKVPDLTGKTSDEAKRLLAETKLKLGNVFPADGKNYVDRVINQDPRPGTEVMEETAVDIYFQNSTEERKTITRSINLGRSENYGATIRVHVEITPSDTNRIETLLEKTVNKSEFPITLTIPVPRNGETSVKVYLDNNPIPYASFTEPG